MKTANKFPYNTMIDRCIIKYLATVILAALAYCQGALAQDDVTYVDDARGFTIAHPSAWKKATRGQSIVFEHSFLSTGSLSFRVQPLSPENLKYKNILKIPDAENDLVRGVEALENVTIQGKGRTKLSSRDALWIKYSMTHESPFGRSYVITYQIVTLNSKGLLFCTYMATGLTREGAQGAFNSGWQAAQIVLASMRVH